MRTSRREFVAAAAAAGLLQPHRAAAKAAVITPEQFGARGDGRSNDTDAFAALSAFVNARGGGTIVLRPVTYIVGKQGRAGSAGPDPKRAMGFPPATIFHFARCSGPLVIRGQGARLRCADGLRFGTFDPRTGLPIHQEAKSRDRSHLAAPYIAMILVESCSGPIDISDLELDGNLQALQIGGRWGGQGWQIPASGVRLIDNRGPERLSRVHSHHHPLDGIYVNAEPDRVASSLFTDVTCDHNARQGCSIVGGRNFRFERCRFLRTGKAGLRSAPGAGVDIEAQGGRTIRNVRFADCEFADNVGAGLIADSGDSADVHVDNCRLVGTTSWSAWPNKPGIRFTKCLFVGALVNAHGDADPNRATQFHDCEFRDDPALSPTREVFGGRGRTRRSAILPKNPNVLFNRCRFSLTHDLTVPHSTRLVRYSDCEMSQRSPVRTRLGGTFVGANRLTGNLDLEAALILGEVTLNGRRLARSG